jgi:hypothetical protein
LPPNFAFQFGEAVLVGFALAESGERAVHAIAEFPSPSVQHVGAYLAGTGNLGHRSAHFQAAHRRQLKLFGELSSRQTHGSLLR